MPEPTQNATIAVLKERYLDARNARDARIRAITTIRSRLAEFARKLSTVEGVLFSAKSVPRMPPDYPADAQIATTLDELRAVCEEMELTEKLLQEAGVKI